MTGFIFDTLDEFKLFLELCRKNDVTAFKYGEYLVQFQPKMPDFTEPEPSQDVQAGGWKRNADLME